jgi:hypothetical protein
VVRFCHPFANAKRAGLNPTCASELADEPRDGPTQRRSRKAQRDRPNKLARPGLSYDLGNLLSAQRRAARNHEAQSS